MLGLLRHQRRGLSTNLPKPYSLRPGCASLIRHNTPPTFGSISASGSIHLSASLIRQILRRMSFAGFHCLRHTVLLQRFPAQASLRLSVLWLIFFRLHSVSEAEGPISSCSHLNSSAFTASLLTLSAIFTSGCGLCLSAARVSCGSGRNFFRLVGDYHNLNRLEIDSLAFGFVPKG